MGSVIRKNPSLISVSPGGTLSSMLCLFRASVLINPPVLSVLS
jgi:hypothetical protein